MKLYDLYPEFNPQRVYQIFLEDLKKSAKGEKTSLQFIHNQLAEKEILHDKERMQVINVGGTVCRSAKVRLLQDKYEIVDITDVPKPGFPTKESFLLFISSIIECEKIVINTADTIKPIFRDGKMDGILLISTKENKMEGLVGEKIGEEIEKYVQEKQGKQIAVSVANDTVCLLLSGLTKYPWNTIAGGIIGTGINFAFFSEEHVVTNLEAGDYNAIIQSDPGKEIDKNSEEQGRYLFEKETSGGYLYQHFNYFLKKYSISYNPITNSAALSEIAAQDIPEVSLVAQLVLTYSVTLAASQIAGLVKFLERDTTMIMQGSLFWKGYGYKEEAMRIVKDLVPEFLVDFVSIENADILGGVKVIL